MCGWSSKLFGNHTYILFSNAKVPYLQVSVESVTSAHTMSAMNGKIIVMENDSLNTMQQSTKSGPTGNGVAGFISNSVSSPSCGFIATTCTCGIAETGNFEDRYQRPHFNSLQRLKHKVLFKSYSQSNIGL